jgi:hypothetical protein
MSIRRFLVILLLLLMPLQATLAAADSCCLDVAVAQSGHQVDATTDSPDPTGACCEQCDFCHLSHAPYVADLADGRLQLDSVAPVPAPEPPIHSFIADVPPRPDRLR